MVAHPANTHEEDYGPDHTHKCWQRHERSETKHAPHHQADTSPTGEDACIHRGPTEHDSAQSKADDVEGSEAGEDPTASNPQDQDSQKGQDEADQAKPTNLLTLVEQDRREAHQDQNRSQKHDHGRTTTTTKISEKTKKTEENDEDTSKEQRNSAELKQLSR